MNRPQGSWVVCAGSRDQRKIPRPVTGLRCNVQAQGRDSKENDPDKLRDRGRYTLGDWLDFCTWQYMWLYQEACTATILASINVFRTLFVQRTSAAQKQKAAAAAVASFPPAPVGFVLFECRREVVRAR